MMRKRDLALVFGIFGAGYMVGQSNSLPHIGINAPTVDRMEMIEVIEKKAGLKNARTDMSNLNLCNTAKRVGFKAENNNGETLDGAYCAPTSGSNYIVLKAK